MPRRIRVPRFVGGSNRLVSPQASNEATINRFVESAMGGGVKIERYMRQAEGMRPFATFNDVDAVGLFGQDGRAFAVVGEIFGEFFRTGIAMNRGTVDYDGTPATIVSNGKAGNQLGVCVAKKYYCYDMLTNVLAEVVIDGGQQIRMIEYLDGYVHAVVDNSDTVYYSDLFDASTFNPLSFYKRNWGSDNISFIKRSGRFLWIIGSRTGEIWADNGDAEIPFAPVSGVFIDKGCIAPFSAHRDGTGLNWLMGDDRGGGIVVRGAGTDPDDISTYAVSAAIQSVMPLGAGASGETNPMAACTALTHQRDGHLFYWLHVPGLDTTPVYDEKEKEWAERAMWDKVHGVWTPHIARTQCFEFERQFVGTKETGTIYELSPRYLYDRVVT